MIKFHWITSRLYLKTHEWCKRMRKRLRTAGERSSWWSFICYWATHLTVWLRDFRTGHHQFSPMTQYQFKDETILIWSYLDRLMLHLILKIITPTFKHVISPLCLHLKGPSVIKDITADIKAALNNGRFNYCLRLDIKRYYATINHKVLLKQLYENYADPILLRYFTDIVTVAIDCSGQIILPKCGIPIRSTLSPFFAALYLASLDKAFARRPSAFYRRYMDDIIILVENKLQYAKARKLLFKILQELKLTLSPHKSWMGLLQEGFHFLGVNFEVARTPQSKIQVAAVDINPRTCRRALDRVALMKQDAVHPAKIQCYLSLWAIWWKSVIRLEQTELIYRWVSFTEAFKHDSVWFGRGLLLFSPYYCLCHNLPNPSNQN